MNKKLLLTTTLAGTMFIAGMANPTFAAKNAAEVRYNHSWVDSNVASIAIELKEGDVDLTKAELTSIVAEKYGNNSVTKVEKDGTEITADDALVGTGAKVTLSNGKTLTLVLFGDVDGDGAIGMPDAQRTAEAYVGREISAEARKAADVTDAAGIAIADAQRIAEYYAKRTTFKGATNYVDTGRLAADQTLAVLGFKADFIKDKVAGQQEAAQKGGEVTVDGAKIIVKVKKAELLSSYRDAGQKDWLALDITDLPKDCTWAITGADFEKTADGMPRVFVDAEQDQITFTLTVNGEQTEITVEILDISEPKVVSIEQAKEDTSTNGALIKEVAYLKADKVDAKYNDLKSANDYAVDVNVNKMTDSTINDVEGRWYKVRVKVEDLDSSLVKAVKLDGSDKVTDTEYKTEVIDEDELYVYLNALDSSVNLGFVSKNATKDQLDEAITAKKKIVIYNEGILNLAGVGVAKTVDEQTDKDKGDTPQKTNLGAISDVTVDGNKITVKGELSKFVAYQFTDEAKNDYKAKMKDQKFVEGGKKYYALVVDLGTLKNDHIWPDTLLKFGTKASDNLKAYYDNAGGTVKKIAGTINNEDESILVWLDASQRTTTIEVRGTTEVDGETSQENFKFTVEFVDTSAPVVRKYDEEKNIVDVNVATESTIGDDYKNNATAVTVDTKWDDSAEKSNKTTINVEARKSAMKVIQRSEGRTIWYALRVNVNANREDLILIDDKKNKIPCSDLVGEITGLSDTEIVLWVDANKESQVFKIANKNNEDATCEITVKTTDKSLIKVTELEVKPVTASTVDLKELPGYGEEFAKNVENNTVATTAKIDPNTKESSSTGKGFEDGKVRILQANRNLLKAFSFRNLGTGKWIPVVVTLNTNVMVKEEGNVATADEKAALGLTTANTTVVWVDASKLQEKNNAITLTTRDNANSGLTETHTFYFDFKELSAFPDIEEKKLEAKAYDFKNNEFKENFEEAKHFESFKSDDDYNKYYLNQDLATITSSREANSNIINVTVEADWDKMYDITGNAGNEGKLASFKVNLGVDLSKGEYYYKDVTVTSADDLAKTPEQILKDSKEKRNPVSTTWVKDGKDAYGCSDSELYFNRYWSFSRVRLDGDHFGTEVIEFTKGDTDTGDSLIVVIKYIQKDYKGDLGALRESYNLPK